MKILKIMIMVFIVIIAILITRWILQKYNLIPGVKYSNKVELTLRVKMLDNNDKPVLTRVKNYGNKFTGNFLITAASNQDTYFDVILINNYKQTNFSINGNKEQKKHKIFIPKTKVNNFIDSKIQISTSNINVGLNDSALILLRNTKDSNSLKRNPIVNTFVSRFAFYNETNKQDLDIAFSSDYKIIKGELNHHMFVFKKLFNEIRSNHYETYPVLSMVNNLKIGEKLQLHTCINIKESIEGSPFFNEYLLDEKLHLKQPIAFFALLDGELQPLYYQDSIAETVKFYEVELGKTILISPKLKLDNKGVHNLNIIALCYPYSNVETFLGSYKATNWSTAIVTDEIPINVTY